jgi:hypothetical protein
MKHGTFPHKTPAEPDTDYLRRHRAHRIIERLPDEILPAPERDYVCNALSKPPEGLKLTMADRDYCIFEVLAAIIDLGFRPTRNETARAKESAGEPAEQSACSIVTKALVQLRVPITERNVEAIWRRRPRKMG